MRHSRMSMLVVLAVAWTVQVLGAVSAQAQEQSDSPKTLEERIEEIDQKVRVSDRKRELEAEADAEKAKTSARLAAGRSGFSLTSADSAYILKIRGYVQADGRFTAAESRVPGT